MARDKAAALGCGLPSFTCKKSKKPKEVLPWQINVTTVIEQRVEDATTGAVIDFAEETIETDETIDTFESTDQEEEVSVILRRVVSMGPQAQSSSGRRRARSFIDIDELCPLEKIGTCGAGPYAETWRYNQRPMYRKVHVNDVDVTGDPRVCSKCWAMPEPTFQQGEFLNSEPTAERTSKFEKVKQQLRESARVLNSVFEKAHGKFTFKRRASKHAQTSGKGKKKGTEKGLLSPKNDEAMEAVPRSRFGGLDLAIRLVYDNFKVAMHTISLRELGQLVQRKFSRGPKSVNSDMTPIYEQRPAVPDTEALLTSGKLNSIEVWAANTSTVADIALPEGLFQALTTSELLKLGGERVDNIEIVKHYAGPPNSPDLEAQAGPMPVLDLAEFNLDDIDNLDDDFDSTSKAKRKDLIKHLGHNRHASFHLITSGPSSYDADINISVHWNQPIIEARTIQKVVAKHIEDPHVFTSKTGDGSDNDGVDRKSAYSMVFQEDGDVGDNPNKLYPALSYPPAQSFILYLHGQGIRLANIIVMLDQLDVDFLVNKKSKWFAGVKFPEHVEWSDDWVQKVGEVCRSEMKEQKCQQMLSGKKDDSLGHSHGLIEKAAKTKQLAMFVQQVVENHLFWRLKTGYRRHPRLYEVFESVWE